MKQVRISDIGVVKGGKRLPKGHLLADKPTEHPYIRVTDMMIDGLDTSKVQFISDETHRHISKYTITDQDIYISIAGTIGLTGIIPKQYNGANLTENAAKITDIKKHLVDTRYLLYILRSNKYYSSLLELAGGSSQPKLALYKIENLDISLPDLPIQQKIASILSTYDDLIEVNEKRIKILEEMAQRLYSEWFVHFRFPGHEKVKLVDSHTSFGMIPERWEVKKLGEIIQLEYGKALKSDQRKNGDIDVYGSSGKVGQHSEKFVSGPGIVVGRKGNVGSIFWVDNDFYPIDTTYYVVSKLPLEYLYYLLSSLTYTTGDSAVPGLNRNSAYMLDILLPSRDIINKFAVITPDIHKQVSMLKKTNKNLSKTRDHLIPQLISGRREVK